MGKRYCFAIDLIDSVENIAEYESLHKSVWPEIKESFYRAGLENVELYRTGNRLFMMLEGNNNFSLEAKLQIDAADPVVQKWENLMSTFQKPLPWAMRGEKWTEMKCIFRLNQ